MPVTDVQKDLDALTMTITTELDASADRAWQLWADPRQLERWWGPPSHPATFTEHDLSPGSRVGYFMTAPDGQKFHGWWTIKETEPPSRLRFVDGFGEGPDKVKDDLPGPAEIVVTLSEAGGRTTMAITSTFASRENMEQQLEMGMEQGMKEAMGQIDAIVAE
jgi:uncharacterized protein YndB with AHSA1/START domain